MKMKKGDQIPDITLSDQDGARINLRRFVDQALIVFFYPKDNTPVCTAEACLFEAHYKELKEEGAEVIGISTDPVSSHKKFATRYHLDYRLLSDPDGEAERAFGVKRKLFGLIKERVTFIFNKEGKLVHTIQSQYNGKRHVKEALAALNTD